MASNISASNIGLSNSGVHLILLGTKTVFSFAPSFFTFCRIPLDVFHFSLAKLASNLLLRCLYRTLRLSQAFAPSRNYVIGSAIKDIRFSKLNTCAAIFI